ncbi:hypothetical protein ACFX11_025548 [Malus domestica]
MLVKEQMSTVQTPCFMNFWYCIMNTAGGLAYVLMADQQCRSMESALEALDIELIWHSSSDVLGFLLLEYSFFDIKIISVPNRSLKSLVNVEVIRHGRLEPLKISSGIKSIVCLNLPSDPGGSSNMNKDRKNMKPSVINDGQLEIVGLKEVLLAQNERIYLDQVQEIRFEFKGAAESVKMRIDGSPLKQLPPGIIDIKISRHSQVNILGNGDCAAKRGFSDSSEPRASGTDDSSNANDKSTEESSNAKDKSTEAGSSAKDKSTEESSSVKDKSTEASSNAQDSYKGRKKFGSADTFKYSETEDNSNAKDKSTEESSNAQDSSKAHKKFGSAGTFKMP